MYVQLTPRIQRVLFDLYYAVLCSVLHSLRAAVPGRICAWLANVRVCGVSLNFELGLDTRFLGRGIVDFALDFAWIGKFFVVLAIFVFFIAIVISPSDMLAFLDFNSFCITLCISSKSVFSNWLWII